MIHYFFSWTSQPMDRIRVSGWIVLGNFSKNLDLKETTINHPFFRWWTSFWLGGSDRSKVGTRHASGKVDADRLLSQLATNKSLFESYLAHVHHVFFVFCWGDNGAQLIFEEHPRFTVIFSPTYQPGVFFKGVLEWIYFLDPVCCCR